MEERFESLESKKQEQEREELRQEYLRDFINFRDNYIDDLPPQRLYPEYPNYHKYKCRGSFFQGIIARIENLIIEDAIIDSHAVEMAKKFINEYKAGVGGKDWSQLLTKEDIEKVNGILDFLIKYLSE